MHGFKIMLIMKWDIYKLSSVRYCVEMHQQTKMTFDMRLPSAGTTLFEWGSSLNKNGTSTVT